MKNINPEIIAVIITSIATFIISIITIISQSRSQNKAMKSETEKLKESIKSEVDKMNKELSVQYITDKRVDWMNTVREELSNYISICYFIAEKYKILNENNGKVPSEESYKINKYSSKLKLFFNFNGDIDKEILLIMNEIEINISKCPNEFDSSKFRCDIKKLEDESQIYLKLEWERVKLEVMGTLNPEELKLCMDEKEKELRTFKK